MAASQSDANGDCSQAASKRQTFAEVVRGDFLLIGAFLIFLGLISTDAYYRAFGLRFQFLTYPWNLIVFRGLLTVIRFPWLWVLLGFMVAVFQVDRHLARSAIFRYHSWRLGVLYLILAVIISFMPMLGTYLGATEAKTDMFWCTSTLPRISRLVVNDNQPIQCPQCLLLLMDSSQVVYFGALGKGDNDALPQTKILSRSNVVSIDTSR